MSKSSRRTFLKRIGGLVPSLTLGRRQLRAESTEDGALGAPPTLTALAEVVLPRRALGEEGLAVAVADFVRWRDGLSPGAELDHAYLSTDELQFAPADRRSEWEAQLEALDRRAREQMGRAFSELEVEKRRSLLDRAMGEPPERMPHPAEAEHVGLAMAAWYFATPAANDLCYGARIGRHACRGLPTAPDEPAAFVAADSVEQNR